MVGTEVYVIAMRPIPLLWLTGIGGPLPSRVCRTVVRGMLDGGMVQVEDEEIQRALGRQPNGRLTLAAACCYTERRKAVEIAAGELITFARSPYRYVLQTLPDVAMAARRRWLALTSGEEIGEDFVAAAREAGLA